MDVLKALAISIALTACYSPELANCTVACGADTDCGDGQRCNAQGLCAGDGVACNASEADAAVTADTQEPDSQVPQTMLRVHVMDQGEVTFGSHLCTMDCTVPVDTGVELTLVAAPKPTRIFEKWEEACGGQPTTSCTITPTGNETRVTAKFKKEMP